MKKKVFSCFLTYPNGGKSHLRRNFDKSRIELEMINLLDEKEVLSSLAETFTLKHGNNVIMTCPSSELTEEKIKSISYPKPGPVLRYTERICTSVTKEDMDLLLAIGGGKLTTGLRHIINEYRNRLKRV